MSHVYEILGHSVLTVAAHSGIIVFAVTGALVAVRARFDIRYGWRSPLAWKGEAPPVPRPAGQRTGAG
ncbi:TRIC cation channel family protein [Streptomyces sp. NPDC001970]